MPLERREGDRRREPAGIRERRKVGRRRGSFRAASRRGARAAALSRPCSSLPIKSLRLSTWRASSPARVRSAVSAFSRLGLLLLALLDQRASCAPARATSAARSRPSRRVRRRFPCAPAPARRDRRPALPTSCRISGSTAPSSMAVRTDCSASSGLTISAGGGRRPMRCSAASTSPITARRPSSDLRMVSSLASSGLSRASVAAIAAFDAAQRSRRCRSDRWLSLRRSSPIARSALEPGLDLGVALLLGPDLFQFLLPGALLGLRGHRDGGCRGALGCLRA